jgi:N-acetylmuramoyl-L-alanine amidase
MGRTELEYNLALAAEVGRELEQAGFAVRMIGQHPGFGARTREARGAALFVSIHHDSVRSRYIGEPQLFSGFSLFVSRHNREAGKSERCASAIGARLRGVGLVPSRYHADAVFGENRPFADAVNGVHYFDNLAVGRSATMASVLVEAGVIVNAEEERRITEPSMRRAVAAAIAHGVGDCLR